MAERVSENPVAPSLFTREAAPVSFSPVTIFQDFFTAISNGRWTCMPLYAVLPPSSAIYGGSFKPLIWQWNFSSGHKIAPYVAAAGGIVFTKSNVPPGDTSQVNFTPQAVAGTRLFVKPRSALFFEGSLGHLSSASLGNHNPGYNVTLVFTVGYTWFKGGR